MLLGLLVEVEGELDVVDAFSVVQLILFTTNLGIARRSTPRRQEAHLRPHDLSAPIDACALLGQIISGDEGVVHFEGKVRVTPMIDV